MNSLPLGSIPFRWRDHLSALRWLLGCFIGVHSNFGPFVSELLTVVTSRLGNVTIKEPVVQ